MSIEEKFKKALINKGIDCTYLTISNVNGVLYAYHYEPSRKGYSLIGKYSKKAGNWTLDVVENKTPKQYTKDPDLWALIKFS